MKILYFDRMVRSVLMIGMTTLIGTTCLLVAPKFGYAQDYGTPMAPPIGADAGADDPVPPVSTVFNWQEVPVDQEVPIQSAVFDQGGYQLYDTVGETIIVKFKNNNLYVMKFAVSSDGSTYFVNTGTSPVLYMPADGYLENATVPGARWYPFTSNFQPSTPVFLGVAPNWSDYVSIGWYPNMVCYGGYWGGASVGVFSPTVGLYISFGGQRFNGWGDYGNYVGNSPAPYHIGYYRQNVYQYAKRTYWGTRTFQGTPSQSDYSRPSFNGGQSNQGRSFRGTSAPPQAVQSNNQSWRSFGTTQPARTNSFQRASQPTGRPTSNFNGARSSSSGSRPMNNGGSHNSGNSQNSRSNGSGSKGNSGR